MSEKILKFFEGEQCIIADPSAAFAYNIKECLLKLGLPHDSVFIARKFAETKELIRSKKPKLLVTEYSFEGNFGLELVDELKLSRPEGSYISIVITKDSSDSVVAESAEEHVDAFIVKPFSAGAFQEKMVAAINNRVNPSPYSQLIQTGKDFMAKKDFVNAIATFTEAKKIKDKPTLACYYSGRCYQLSNQLQKSLQEYVEGRRFNPLHYHCLTGEFELLISLKRYAQAFDRIDLIKNNFPLTPLRLGQIFVASIFSGKFDSMHEYYELLKKIERRPAELTRLATMAMLSAGKHFLKNKNVKLATEYYEKGLIVSGRDFETGKSIVSDLLLVSQAKEAEKMLKRLDPSEIGSPRYNQLSFKVDCVLLPKHVVIEKGRKMVFEGSGDPEIYRKLVQILAEEKKSTLAESIINRAVADFPNLRAELYALLDKAA